MSRYTKDQIVSMACGYTALRLEIEQYIEARLLLDPDLNFARSPDVEDIEFNVHDPEQGEPVPVDTVTVVLTAPACRRGCCGRDYHTVTFPLAHLWADDWAQAIETSIETKAARKARKEREEQEEQESRVAEREQRERRLARELAIKYPEELDGHG